MRLLGIRIRKSYIKDIVLRLIFNPLTLLVIVFRLLYLYTDISVAETIFNIFALGYFINAILSINSYINYTVKLRRLRLKEIDNLRRVNGFKRGLFVNREFNLYNNGNYGFMVSYNEGVDKLITEVEVIFTAKELIAKNILTIDGDKLDELLLRVGG